MITCVVFGWSQNGKVSADAEAFFRFIRKIYAPELCNYLPRVPVCFENVPYFYCAYEDVARRPPNGRKNPQGGSCFTFLRVYYRIAHTI